MRAWPPQRVRTRFGKSCIPDPFSTFSPHLEALRKTMLDLVDSDYPILSRVTQYYLHQPSKLIRPLLLFLFSQATNGLGRTGNLNCGNRLTQVEEAVRMSSIFLYHHRTLSWTTIHNFLNIRRDLKKKNSWRLVPHGYRRNSTLAMRNRHGYRRHRHYIHLQISSLPNSA